MGSSPVAVTETSDIAPVSSKSHAGTIVAPDLSLHKILLFSLKFSSVNQTKSAVSCGFAHIYWRNAWWKASFFVLCYIKDLSGNLCSKAKLFRNDAFLYSVTHDVNTSPNKLKNDIKDISKWRSDGKWVIISRQGNRLNNSF